MSNQPLRTYKKEDRRIELTDADIAAIEECGNIHISGSLSGIRKMTGAYKTPVKIGSWIYNAPVDLYYKINPAK